MQEKYLCLCVQGNESRKLRIWHDFNNFSVKNLEILANALFLINIKLRNIDGFLFSL
jgi:hypothetical protein